MNNEEEKCDSIVETNYAGRRGRGRKKNNQDLGRVRFIEEIISKAKVESFT